MDKNMVSLLKQGFTVPPPEKKEAFFRRAPLPAIGIGTFLGIQAAYIRKRVWVFSFSLFIAALVGSCMLGRDMLWDISAFMPLLACMLVTESSRSGRHGMAELEQSSRFSQKTVLLARLMVLGLGNLVLTCLLVPVVLQSSGKGVLQVGVFLLCPYLATSFLGVHVLRKVRGREADVICIGTAFLVSFGNTLLRRSCPRFYENATLGWWIFAVLFFSAGTIYQYGRMLKQGEELVWNL